MQLTHYSTYFRISLGMISYNFLNFFNFNLGLILFLAGKVQCFNRIYLLSADLSFEFYLSSTLNN